MIKKPMTVMIFLVLAVSVMSFTGCGGGSHPDLPDGLVAYYPYNGDANDALAVANPTDIGSAVSYTQDRFANTNGACLFNGTSSSYISIPTITLDPNSGFSISVWVKNDSTQSNGHPLYCSLFDLSQSGTTTIQFQVNPSAPVLTLNQTFTANEWVHLTVTYDNSTGSGQLYINGALADSDTATGTVGSINLSGLGVSTYWKGTMDELRIYNRVLTANEIQQLYQYHNN